MTPEALTQIEQALNISLPNFYKRFMSEQDDHFFDLKLDYGEGHAEPLHTLHFHHEAEMIIRENTILQQWNEVNVMAEGYFSIGNDGHGNFFLIQLGQEKGKVYLLDHEEYEEEELFVKNLEVVSKSLEGFKQYVIREMNKLGFGLVYP